MVKCQEDKTAGRISNFGLSQMFRLSELTVNREDGALEVGNLCFLMNLPEKGKKDTQSEAKAVLIWHCSVMKRKKPRESLLDKKA